MITSIVVAVAVVYVCWMVWSRWHDWRTSEALLSPSEEPPKTLAFEAFLHGNSCLTAGRWAEATAAFERARTLDPKRPYVAERLAEVDRQHHAASTLAAVAVAG
jgi:cytochrome c-type biogenesis protein CcmH/NrfG